MASLVSLIPASISIGLSWPSVNSEQPDNSSFSFETVTDWLSSKLISLYSSSSTFPSQRKSPWVLPFSPGFIDLCNVQVASFSVLTPLMTTKILIAIW